MSAFQWLSHLGSGQTTKSICASQLPLLFGNKNSTLRHGAHAVDVVELAGLLGAL